MPPTPDDVPTDSEVIGDDGTGSGVIPDFVARLDATLPAAIKRKCSRFLDSEQQTPDDLSMDWEVIGEEPKQAAKDFSGAQNMLAIARNLVERGFSVIPLDHPDDTWVTDSEMIGKTPAIKWAPYQERRPTDAELVAWFGKGRKRNAAIVTGSISSVVVVDGDTPEGLAWMHAHLPATPMRTKTVKGEHWSYRHPGVRVKNKVRIRTGDPAVKIDIRADGGYAVTVGSLHSRRVTYEPLTEWPPTSELPTFDPTWIEPSRTDDIMPPVSKVPNPPLPVSIGEGSRNDLLFREGCKLRRGGMDAPEILAALTGLNSQRCHPPLDAREIEAIAQSCTRYEPSANLSTDFVRHKTGNRKDQIIADDQGNIRLGLASLGLSFSYDAFANVALATHDGKTQPLDDALLNRAWLQLDEMCRFRPSLDFFLIVVNDLARRKSFHPVRDYFDALTWDSIPRIETWLRTYGGAADTAYTRAVGTLFFIAAVRRIQTPGCKFDTILILEGEQGMNKSKAVRALCPCDEWFSDDLPLGADAKQTIERTAGKFLIEASELQGYSNADVERLKSFLSRQTDGPCRLAYGRSSIERPRQFILIGTTNLMTEYLQDSTGNRRFWPLRIRQFQLDALKRDRDQLWAEAVFREALGETIELREELWPLAAAEQEARRQVDPWEERLDERVDFNRDAISVNQLWAALGDAAKYFKKNDATRIAKVMQSRGFTRKKKVDEIYVVNGQEQRQGAIKRVWSWVRDGTDPTEVLIVCEQDEVAY